MPRFVLLYHRCPPEYEKSSHWDWMLEHGEVLWTWQLLELPVSWQVVLADKAALRMPRTSAQTILVQKLPDHRLAYLDHEGAISTGRGEVEQCDAGTYQLIRQEGGQMEIRLEGTVLHCTVEVEENRLTVVDESRVQSPKSRTGES